MQGNRIEILLASNSYLAVDMQGDSKTNENQFMHQEKYNKT